MHKIEGFPVSKGRICLMSCIADIFNFYNLEVSESIIFTLSEACLFYYKHFDIERELRQSEHLKVFMLKLGGMQYDIPLMLNNVIQYFNIRTETQSCFEMNDIKRFVTEHINQERPVLSLLSRNHLDYMDKKFRDDITHSINIYGYDWDNNCLYVSDTFIPTVPVRLYQGPLNVDSYYNSLMASMDIFNKEFPFRNITFLLDKVLPFNYFSEATLLLPLKKIASNFFSVDCNEDGIAVGLNALKQFVSDFADWLKEEATPQMLNLMMLIHHRITNFGGPVVTNQLMTEYMECLTKKNHKLEYEEVKNHFSNLCRKWFIIANMFCKASLGKMEDTKMNLYQRLVDILDSEECVYNKIMEL